MASFREGGVEIKGMFHEKYSLFLCASRPGEGEDRLLGQDTVLSKPGVSAATAAGREVCRFSGPLIGEGDRGRDSVRAGFRSVYRTVSGEEIVSAAAETACGLPSP